MLSKKKKCSSLRLYKKKEILSSQIVIRQIVVIAVFGTVSRHFLFSSVDIIVVEHTL